MKWPACLMTSSPPCATLLISVPLTAPTHKLHMAHRLHPSCLHVGLTFVLYWQALETLMAVSQCWAHLTQNEYNGTSFMTSHDTELINCPHPPWIQSPLTGGLGTWCTFCQFTIKIVTKIILIGVACAPCFISMHTSFVYGRSFTTLRKSQYFIVTTIYPICLEHVQWCPSICMFICLAHMCVNAFVCACIRVYVLSGVSDKCGWWMVALHRMLIAKIILSLNKHEQVLLKHPLWLRIA